MSGLISVVLGSMLGGSRALFSFRGHSQAGRRDISLGHAFGQRQRRFPDRHFWSIGSRQRVAVCLAKSMAVRGDRISGLLHDRLFVQFADAGAGKRRRERPRARLCRDFCGAVDWSRCRGFCIGRSVEMSGIDMTVAQRNATGIPLILYGCIAAGSVLGGVARYLVSLAHSVGFRDFPGRPCSSTSPALSSSDFTARSADLTDGCSRAPGNDNSS